MQGENKSYRYLPADTDAESALVFKLLYFMALLAFTLAVWSGGDALRDYSQSKIWNRAIATVHSERNVCRFRFANPGPKTVTVDHDVYCDDKQRMAEYSASEYNMFAMKELGVSFRNASNNIVFTKIKAPEKEAIGIVPGANVEIRFSIISETNASLERTVGQTFSRSSKIFVVSFAIFVVLASILMRRALRYLQAQNT